MSDERTQIGVRVNPFAGDQLARALGEQVCRRRKLGLAERGCRRESRVAAVDSRLGRGRVVGEPVEVHELGMEREHHQHQGRSFHLKNEFVPDPDEHEEFL